MLPAPLSQVDPPLATLNGTLANSTQRVGGHFSIKRPGGGHAVAGLIEQSYDANGLPQPAVFSLFDPNWGEYAFGGAAAYIDLAEHFGDLWLVAYNDFLTFKGTVITFV